MREHITNVRHRSFLEKKHRAVQQILRSLGTFTQCYDSRVKWGTLDEDLTKESGDPIHCNMAILLEFRNGRKLISFLTGRGLLGFAGEGIDRETDMTTFPIDRIHPIRDVKGMSSDEIIASEARGEGALEGAEGVCMFETKEFKTSKGLSCVSKYESDNKKNGLLRPNECAKCNEAQEFTRTLIVHHVGSSPAPRPGSSHPRRYQARRSSTTSALGCTLPAQNMLHCSISRARSSN